eukprot:5544372-Alexandrium_andersonii.AAC.1
MSASLVGSEMCIRDRVRVVGRSWGRGGAVAVPRRHRGGSSATGTRDSVSYTHLTLPTICSV